MRPTKGEMRVTLASAQAMAWWRPKRRDGVPLCQALSAGSRLQSPEYCLLMMGLDVRRPDMGVS